MSEERNYCVTIWDGNYNLNRIRPQMSTHFVTLTETKKELKSVLKEEIDFINNGETFPTDGYEREDGYITCIFNMDKIFKECPLVDKKFPQSQLDDLEKEYKKEMGEVVQRLYELFKSENKMLTDDKM